MGKRIGILGSGAVGIALAKGFAQHGYEVMIGTNSPSKLKELSESTGTKSGSFSEAAAFGAIIILAVKGSAAEKSLNPAITEKLRGKTVIDATNPIAEEPPVNGVLRYFTGPNESLMERLQKIAPEAHFVKGFSSIGSAFMVNPDFGAQKPAMFFCGNSDPAKAEAADIFTRFGFEPVDMGKAESARAIEPLAILWCIPGIRENRWSNAFAFLRK